MNPPRAALFSFVPVVCFVYHHKYDSVLSVKHFGKLSVHYLSYCTFKLHAHVV